MPLSINLRMLDKKGKPKKEIVPMKIIRRSRKVPRGMARLFKISAQLPILMAMLSISYYHNKQTIYQNKIDNISYRKHRETHDVDLGFAFTDYRVQGLTLKALIIMLNKQSACHDIPTIYVGFSRLTKLANLMIWPINCNDPTAIEHLTKLTRHVAIKLWKQGYDGNGKWDKRRLQHCV